MIGRQSDKSMVVCNEHIKIKEQVPRERQAGKDKRSGPRCAEDY